MGWSPAVVKWTGHLLVKGWAGMGLLQLLLLGWSTNIGRPGGPSRGCVWDKPASKVRFVQKKPTLSPGCRPRGRLLLNHPSSAGRLIFLVLPPESKDTSLPDKWSVWP